MLAICINIRIETIGRAGFIMIFGGERCPVIPPQRVPCRPHSSLLKVAPNLEDEVICVDIMVNLKLNAGW